MDRKQLAWSAALVLLTLLAYLPATAGGFVWDDEDEYLTHNRALTAPGGFRHIWLAPRATPQYYPLVFSTFWVEYRLWGFHPAGYHVVNILLHGLNAVLLWRVLGRLGVPAAWLAAAVFALHPVNVESVAWVQERKNVLSGLFYFSALLTFFRFADGGPPSRVGPRGWYALTVLFTACALLSKTATCTLPAAMLVLAWFRNGRITRRDLLATAPLFLVAVGLSLVTVWVEKYHVGSQQVDWHLSPVERVLIAGRALWFYLGKLAWPVHLSFIYPRWQIDPHRVTTWIFPLAFGALVAVLSLLRSRVGRGPLAAVLLFAGTLAPVLGFISFYFMVYSFVADHFLYLAGVSVIALAVGLAATALGRLPARPPWLPVAAATTVLLALGILTWRRAGVYESQQDLWADTLEKNPACWLAHNNLGNELARRDNLEGAVEHYRWALELRPEYWEALYNLGVARSRQGELAEAKEALSAAVRLRPDHAGSFLNLGAVLAGQGAYDAAIERLHTALRLDPDSAAAHYNLALAYGRLGRPADARDHLAAAVRLQPDRAAWQFELGQLLTQQGQAEEAAECFRRAVVLRPADPRYRYALAEALQRLGRTEAARQQFQQARRLQFR